MTPDVFDALVTRRVYKQALPLEETVATIRRGAGTHFDPDVVRAFEARLDDFKRIAGIADPARVAAGG